MTSPDRSNERGFTLLEMLVAMGLLLVTLVAIGLALDANNRSYARGEGKIEVQQAARHALGTIARELRVAGFFPENFLAAAPDPLLANPLQIATDRELAVYGDLDDSGASHVFLYCLDGTLLRRGKAAPGDATAYWCPAGEILAENVTDLRFSYHDDGDAPIPASGGPPFALDGQSAGSAPAFDDVTERGAVRRVVVTLTVTRDVWKQDAEVFTLGSEVNLRNVR